MPSINVDLDYFSHRKTVRLIGLLGRGAEVLPIRLWSYCGKFHCDTGRLAGYSEQEIESAAAWWGKPGELLPAMKLSEYMSQDAQGWFMHDWIEHQGHLAAFKIKGKAMAEARWKKARDAVSNAVSIAASNAIQVVGSVSTVSSESGKGNAEGKGPTLPKLSELQREPSEVVGFKSEIGLLMGREVNDPWGYIEECGMVEVLRRPNWKKELAVLKAFKSETEFFPQSISSLLENWGKTLDRARNAPAKVREKTIGDKTAERLLAEAKKL